MPGDGAIGARPLTIPGNSAQTVGRCHITAAIDSHHSAPDSILHTDGNGRSGKPDGVYDHR